MSADAKRNRDKEEMFNNHLPISRQYNRIVNMCQGKYPIEAEWQRANKKHYYNLVAYCQELVMEMPEDERNKYVNNAMMLDCNFRLIEKEKGFVKGNIQITKRQNRSKTVLESKSDDDDDDDDDDDNDSDEDDDPSWNILKSEVDLLPIEGLRPPDTDFGHPCITASIALMAYNATTKDQLSKVFNAQLSEDKNKIEQEIRRKIAIGAKTHTTWDENLLSISDPSANYKFLCLFARLSLDPVVRKAAANGDKLPDCKQCSNPVFHDGLCYQHQGPNLYALANQL